WRRLLADGRPRLRLTATNCDSLDASVPDTLVGDFHIASKSYSRALSIWPSQSPTRGRESAVVVLNGEPGGIVRLPFTGLERCRSADRRTSEVADKEVSAMP